MRDFEAYWSAGATWNAQADPYGRAIWAAERTVPGVDGTRDETLPFVGPPATIPFWSAIGRLPYDAAARLWWTTLGLALLALVAVVLRASRTRVTIFSFFAAFTLAIAFGPVTSDLALGQIALLALLGAAVASCYGGLLGGRLAIAALGSFVAFFQPNVAIGLVSQLGRNRTTLAMALGAGATYFAGVLALGWTWPVDYARGLIAHQGGERLSAIQLTPAAIAYAFGTSPEATAIVAAVAVLAAIVAAGLLWQRVRDPFARFAAFTPLAPFVAGFFHEHDLVVAYVAAVWCAVRTRGSIRSLALAGTLLVAIDWFGLAQRPSGIIQSALLALAVSCAFAAFEERTDWRAIVAAAIPLAAIFTFAAWLAAAHPAPVWPDALGTFHATITASVFAVWHDEQIHSGLLAAVPAWGLLRALSLLGCALLSCSIFFTAGRGEADLPA
jgi:hypothetical protein